MKRILPVLPLLALLLSGCPRRVDFGPHGRVEDPHYVLDAIVAAWERVHGLVGEGRISVDTEEVDGTLQMAVEVAEPAYIYLETVDLVGTPRGVFATDGAAFAFYRPDQHVFYAGPATAEMVGRFLPVELPPEQLASAMLGEVPLLLDAEEARLEVDEATGTYVIFLRKGRVRQRVEVATRDLRLVSIQTRGAPAIDASYDDHEELLPGALFPTTIVLTTPRARVRLRYSNVRLNQPVDPAGFALQPPPGARVERMR